MTSSCGLTLCPKVLTNSHTIIKAASSQYRDILANARLHRVRRGGIIAAASSASGASVSSLLDVR
jgi:hypothetical protein